MAKLTLTNITSQYASVDALNANFEAIEEALENTLSRDGTVPNTMEAALNMDGQAILNLPTPTTAGEPIPLSWAVANYPDFQTIAGLDDEIEALAAILTEIVGVYGIRVNISVVASAITNVNNVGNSINDVNTVANNITDVTAVKNNAVNINKVAGKISKVEDVADSINNVDDVAAAIPNINTVVNYITPISTLGTIHTDISVTAAIAPDVTTVASNVLPIINTASNITDINTVAGISGDVTTVAGLSASDLATVASNDTNITTVATNISDVIDVSSNMSDITTVANDLNEPVSEIETVAANIANVNLVGNDIANVNVVATDSSNIGTVASNLSGTDTIGTVAANISNVNTVGGISSDVTTVASDTTNIGTIATNLTGTDTIGTVASNIANVNLTGNNIANVNLAANNMANITSVSSNATNITTVATNIANVNTVAGLDTEISALGPIASDITSAAALDPADIAAAAALGPDIGTVAGISSEITTVAGISSAVSAVSTNATNVNLVGSNISNVNALGSISSDVTTVANLSTEIADVVADATDIGTVATNINNVNTVAGINTQIATVSADSTVIQTVAANIADVNNFADTYFISATAPLSPTTGDLWYDTSVSSMKVYNGTTWGTINVPASIDDLSDVDTTTTAPTDGDALVWVASNSRWEPGAGGGSGVGGIYNSYTSAATLSAFETALVDTSAGAFTLTLPASPSEGDKITIADESGSFGTNNLTVARNGNNIQDVAADLVCDLDYAKVDLHFRSGNWTAFALIGAKDGVAITANTTDTLTNKTITSAANTLSIAAGDITSGTIDTARLGSGTADSTTYLRGDGAWSTIAGLEGLVSNYTTGAGDNTAALEATEAESNIGIALITKGDGAISRDRADNTTTGGNWRGGYSVDFQKLRSSAYHVASGSRSAILNGGYNSVSGGSSAVCGGDNNSVSGNNNLVSGFNHSIAGGYSVIGGRDNTSNNDVMHTAMFGAYNDATQGYGFTIGYKGKNRESGKLVFSGANDLNTSGTASYDHTQTELYNSAVETTDATPTNFYNWISQASVSGAKGYLIQTGNSARAFQIMVVALDTGVNNDAAYWKVEGLIKCGGSSTSMAFVGTPTITQVAATAGASTWSLGWKSWTFASDGWGLQATGAASTTIKWQASFIMAHVA